MTQPSVEPPLRKKNFGTGAQNIYKNRYQSLPVLSKFALFLNFFQNILLQD